MSRSILKNVVIFTVLILCLLAVFFTLLINEEVRTMTEFREKSFDHLALSSRTAVASEFSDRFTKCEQMDKYDHFTATQPGNMTEEQLREAIVAGEECGSYFPDKRRFSYEKMKEFSAKMKESSIFSHLGFMERSTKGEFLDIWSSLEKNLETQSDIFEDLNQIQSEYWSTELSLREGELTPEEREEVFGDLNREAQSSIEKMSKTREELKELKKKEQKLWESLTK